jgi:hypothetical protein
MTRIWNTQMDNLLACFVLLCLTFSLLVNSNLLLPKFFKLQDARGKHVVVSVGDVDGFLAQ